MPGKTRRIIAGIGWVAGSLIAWAAAWSAFGFVVFMYLGNQRRFRFPEWSTDAYNWTAVAGSLIIPAVVAVLAIRGHLPGTGAGPSQSRGFPIENARPPGEG